MHNQKKLKKSKTRKKKSTDTRSEYMHYQKDNHLTIYFEKLIGSIKSK